MMREGASIIRVRQSDWRGTTHPEPQRSPRRLLLEPCALSCRGVEIIPHDDVFHRKRPIYANRIAADRRRRQRRAIRPTR
jgi:hypothetical protein